MTPSWCGGCALISTTVKSVSLTDCIDSACCRTDLNEGAPEDACLYLVEQIVIKLDADCHGTLHVAEVKELLSKLSGRPLGVIPDTHPEVVAFVGLSIEAVIEKLWKSVKPMVIEKYYRALFKLALDAELPERVGPSGPANAGQADLYLIEQIVFKLDGDCNGTLCIKEVKYLLNQLSGRPLSVIPDTHPELVAFTGVSIETAIEKLWKSVKPKVIEQYYRNTHFTCFIWSLQPKLFVSLFFGPAAYTSPSSRREMATEFSQIVVAIVGDWFARYCSFVCFFFDQ